MSEQNYYPKAIEISGLSKDRLNVVQVADGVDVVVLTDGTDIQVLRDVCPHMGAPLSQGKFCSKEKTLHCPWHGYVFDAKSCELKHNPNEAVFGKMKHLYKTYNAAATPKFKLRSLGFEVRGDKLYVRRGSA